MEPTTIADIVSKVGFPIATFCAMFYLCNATIKENTNALIELSHLIRKKYDDEND
jgi:hypothetical protein